eukprot:scaffold4304_cov71-Cylindrotheca_fusiformis.AAC.2
MVSSSSSSSYYWRPVILAISVFYATTSIGRVVCFVSTSSSSNVHLRSQLQTTTTRTRTSFIRHLDRNGGRNDDTAFPKKKYNISLLLIDHYDSFTYNLYDMLAQLTVEPPKVVAKDAFDGWKDAFQCLYKDNNNNKEVDGIILSPGPGSPQEQPAFSKEAIRYNPQLPILGVCLGHQLLAMEYGGRVDKAPIPIHGQDHWIIIQPQPQSRQSLQNNRSIDEEQDSTILKNLPFSFRAVRYHSLAATDLPKDTLQVTAMSSDDGVIQGIQHVEFPHYGVQFHPESIGTQHGMELLENFCRLVEKQKLDKEQSSNNTDVDHSPISVQKEDTSSVATNMEETISLPPRFQVFLHEVIKPSSSSSSSVSSETVMEPVEAFEALYGSKSHAIWLDSSSSATTTSGRGTVDIMAAPLSSADIIEYYVKNHQNQNTTTTDVLTRLENELYANGKSATRDLNVVVGHDFRDIETIDDQANLTWPPFDFRGGYLGMLGYDIRYDTQQFLKRQEYAPVDGSSSSTTTTTTARDRDDQGSRQEHHQGDGTTTTTTTTTNSSSIPDAAFFLARQSLVYHHPTSTWFLIGLAEHDCEIDGILEWMQSTSSILTNPTMSKPEMEGYVTEAAKGQKGRKKPLAFVPNRPKSTYQNDISRCHEFIELGESYELCLTNQLEATATNKSNRLSTWDLYRRLRSRNPAPYSAYVQWNLDNPGGGVAATKMPPLSKTPNSFAICSSSPERFMSVKPKKIHPLGPVFLQAEAKPIKGTCARVMPQNNGVIRTDSEIREDDRRARSLEISLKNRAENLMIVDLLRNDMSRVCQVGTVHVAKLMAIESFATVHQMVSTIRGTLSEQTGTTTTTKTPIDLLRASFPGGSMTGAPKMRTMELLEELEEHVSRGPYAGSIGYLSVNFCMDMNIVIRSAVITPSSDGGRKISIGAGGAITALSEREDEYDEMLLKARAVIQAVQEWEEAAMDNPQAEPEAEPEAPTKTDKENTSAFKNRA